MIFRFTVISVAFLAVISLNASKAAETQPLEVGGVALSRPLLLRSDFVAKDVLQMLFVRSHLSTPEAAARFVGNHPGLCSQYFHADYIAACKQYVQNELSSPPVPQLLNEKYYEVGLGFDAYGGSRFRNVIMQKRIHFWETEFMGDNYRTAMNEYMAKMVARNPEQYRGILSEETIAQYERWAKTRKGPLNNPRLANGDPCVFHHDVSKRILVVVEKEHTELNSLPGRGHISGKLKKGGRTIWGDPQPFDKVLKTTALRWGGMAGTDLIVSSLGLAMGGAQDKSQYIANAGSVAAAYLAATLSESLIVAIFPFSVGNTPIWLGLLGFSSGGPAAWVASGVYMGVRAAVMYGWEKYQLAQARRIEDACREAERATRVWLLTQSLSKNTQLLESIVSGATP